MTAALFRQCMDALCPAGWSAADAAGMLTNLDGRPPKRETVRDWLTRDAVPDWVQRQLEYRIREQQTRLAEALRKIRS